MEENTIWKDMVQEDIEEDTKESKDLSCSWMDRINIVNFDLQTEEKKHDIREENPGGSQRKRSR